MPSILFNIAIGYMIGDACIYRLSNHSKIKFEQVYIHKDYIHHLVNLFSNYTFQDNLYIRYELRGLRKGQIKSYSFITFSHPIFDPFWNLFMIDNKKTIPKNLVLDYLSEEGLAY